jgi:potassium efflux system protein
MRSTTVLMTDGNLMIIPNAVLVKTVVINHSFPDNSSLVRIELGVAYGSDVGKVKSLMLEASSEDPRIMASPAPAVFFKSFGDFALSFLMTCYAKSFADKMAITDQLNTAIDAKFRATGIDIPFPIRTVYLKSHHELPE